MNTIINLFALSLSLIVLIDDMKKKCDSTLKFVIIFYFIISLILPCFFYFLTPKTLISCVIVSIIAITNILFQSLWITCRLIGVFNLQSKTLDHPPIFHKNIIIKLIFPVLSYIIISIFIIVIYASIYSFLDHNDIMFIRIHDSVYFSASTFFTVGYGDIFPVDATIKTFSVIEMFLGGFLSMVYIPILIVLFQTYLNYIGHTE